MEPPVNEDVGVFASIAVVSILWMECPSQGVPIGHYRGHIWAQMPGIVEIARKSMAVCKCDQFFTETVQENMGVKRKKVRGVESNPKIQIG